MVECKVCRTKYAPESACCPGCHEDRKTRLRDARSHAGRLARACIALMDGSGWREQFECDHGVPVGRDCGEPQCSLNPVRKVRDTLTFYEVGKTGKRGLA